MSFYVNKENKYNPGTSPAASMFSLYLKGMFPISLLTEKCIKALSFKNRYLVNLPNTKPNMKKILMKLNIKMQWNPSLNWTV